MWERVEGLLPEYVNLHPFGGGRPRVPDRIAFNAVFFVLRTGCQWKALNSAGFCSPSTAHSRFQEWAGQGLFLRMWQAGLYEYDELKGIDWKWQSMDGALTKAPLGGDITGPNPTDRAKGGTKRNLHTDGRGIPLGIVVAGANINDFKLARQTLKSTAIGTPTPTRRSPQGMCLDKGFDFNEIRGLLDEFGFAAHIRCRGEEAKAVEAGQRARRWVVERTHSWLNRFRRVLIRWEKKPENYLAMLHFACAQITFQQAGGLFG